MYCDKCKQEFGKENRFCPKCGKMLRYIRLKDEKDMYDDSSKKYAETSGKDIYLTFEENIEEYPLGDVEHTGSNIVVAVSKYNIKMEISQITIDGKPMIIYERTLLPSEVEYNLFILRYIVNNKEGVNYLNGTKYPFPNVGKFVNFIDVNDDKFRVRHDVDITTWGTLRVFGMEPFMRKYRPRPFDPATRLKGDRIRFYIDPTDISYILVEFIKVKLVTGKSL